MEELIFDFSPYIGLEPLVVDQIIIFPDFDLQGREQDKLSYTLTILHFLMFQHYL